MSKNINQVFIANPASSMIGTDLFYLGRSPYGASSDYAITWTNVLASIIAGAAGGSNTQIQYNNSGALAGDTGFTTNGSGSVVATTSLSGANLNMSGNTFSSINTNGTMYIEPNGSGTIVSGTTATQAQISTYTGSSNGIMYLVGDNSVQAPPICSVVGLQNTPLYQLYRTNSSTFGTYQAVSNPTTLSSFQYYADDGTSFKLCAQINANVVGTVSTGIIPTSLTFSIMSASGSLRNGMGIYPTAEVGCGEFTTSRNFVPSYTTQATAGATTTLTILSNQLQYFTGTLNQTVKLPVASTLVSSNTGIITPAFTYTIVNNSTGTVTVQSSGANTITVMAPNTQATFTCILTSGTTAASWNSNYVQQNPALVWNTNANTSISAAVGNGYVLTSGSPTTVTLPTTFAAGALISIAGQGAAWTMALGASTNVKVFGNTYTTSFASTNNTDTIQIIGIVANTTWGILSMSTTGFTAS